MDNITTTRTSTSSSDIVDTADVNNFATSTVGIDTDNDDNNNNNNNSNSNANTTRKSPYTETTTATMTDTVSITGSNESMMNTTMSPIQIKVPSTPISNTPIRNILVETATSPFPTDVSTTNPATTTTPTTPDGDDIGHSGILNRSLDSAFPIFDRKQDKFEEPSIDDTNVRNKSSNNISVDGLPQQKQQHQQQQQYRSLLSNRLQLALPPPTITGLNTSATSTGSSLRGVVQDSSTGSSTIGIGDTEQQNQQNNNFAEIVKERTRLRREREDAALSNLTVQVSRLEAALSAESKRRTKAIHTIQQHAVSEIQQMEDTLRKQIHEETIVVEQRLNSIEQRVQQLELRWNNDVTSISTDLERNRRELDNQLKDLYNTVDRERQSRLSRESIFEKQLNDISIDYQERWTKERQDRIITVSTIEDSIQQQAKNYEQLTINYETTVNTELQYLINDIEREIIERQTNDDEIVAALNRYTEQLQQTLSYATSM